MHGIGEESDMAGCVPSLDVISDFGEQRDIAGPDGDSFKKMNA